MNFTLSLAIFYRYELTCALKIEQFKFVTGFHRNQSFTKIVKKDQII